MQLACVSRIGGRQRLVDYLRAVAAVVALEAGPSDLCVEVRINMSIICSSTDALIGFSI